MTENTSLELASEFIHHTNKNVFLTGKAGTGKTTFLHNLKNTLHKRMAIVAPTGVAAINAGGVTIHSFFQLPFGPHIPDSFLTTQNFHKFSKERINVIKSLDLLVIDEISMVRADMLDAIDEVFRKYKNRNQPFGGVQLLMIGDLHQLAPVIKDEEWNLLKTHYDTIYFFGSRALRKTNPVRIELMHIYRQSDTKFIDLLNRIRENNLDTETLAKLNERFIHNFKPAEDEGYITLTTHNASAQQINTGKLEDVAGKIKSFEAVITGDFPPFSYPTEQTLMLKKGAQVMFVKNDASRDKLFYNGKIGQVARIEQDAIFVKCKGDYAEIEVTKAEWRNVKYALNPQTKEIEEQVIGSFSQYPLKLAWAITIHKSQGLTFEKAIIDANASFAHGQVYVALSRCKSLEGMVLSTRIGMTSVKTDGTVAAYSRDASSNPPDLNQLSFAKIDFQKSLLAELFDFNEIKKATFLLSKVVEENAGILNPLTVDAVKLIRSTAENEIFIVADKFQKQLAKLTEGDSFPLEDPEVKIRVEKACAYFSDRIENFLYPDTKNPDVETDNSALKKSVMQALENLQKEVFIKRNCMKVSLNGFDTTKYLQAKANADVDFKAKVATPDAKKLTAAPRNMAHGKLYGTLKSWRNEIAAENDMLDYLVLPMKTIIELTQVLPRTITQLSTVKGIGKAKVKQYGEALIEMIREYCEDNGIEQREDEVTVKKTKPHTRQVSYEMHQEGKSVAEIALIRGVTAGTVLAHLLSFIESGELDIYKLFPAESIRRIVDYVSENKQETLTEMKIALGDDIDYAEIRAVLTYLRVNEM